MDSCGSTWSEKRKQGRASRLFLIFQTGNVNPKTQVQKSNLGHPPCFTQVRAENERWLLWSNSYLKKIEECTRATRHGF